MIRRADIAIVGGGIAGLAHAYQAARRGLSVVLFERDSTAQGASVRNFGMIMPLGATPGVTFDQATRSLNHWKWLAAEMGVWHNPCGALMVAYHQDEMLAMRELAASDNGRDYNCSWLDGAAAARKCTQVETDGLLGGLWTPSVMVVDPREIMTSFPEWLAERYSVVLRYGTEVTSMAGPVVETTTENWQAERIIVCPGTALDILYPEYLSTSSLTYCKLQMMRTVAQPDGWKLGPVVLSGLSLRHYPVFKDCEATSLVANRIAQETPELDRWGIHLMVAQNGRNELIIGDSHEYSAIPQWRDNQTIDSLLLEQLQRFLTPASLVMDQRWYGVYTKHSTANALILSPEPNVRIITGLGGLGMTLSLALADDILESW